MRVLTYLVAAALLWAVASSGPTTSPPPRDAHGADAGQRSGSP
jgi:hypothetical protein